MGDEERRGVKERIEGWEGACWMRRWPEVPWNLAGKAVEALARKRGSREDEQSGVPSSFARLW